MVNKPLVSVIIISYKNYEYIYQAIDSVLIQKYQNIELIISNDGSNDFNQKEVIKYIKKNSKKNIISFTVNNNKTNLGTVKNINNAIRLSKGNYILIFAADDVMNDSKTVSNFINAFKSLPPKELIVTSQIGMYDIKLKKLFEYFVSETNINKIKNLSPKKLFGELALSCIMPGVGTCYKKEIFDRYGPFDQKYILVEDYSSSLKYTRLGIKYNYFDFVSFKHRDGGISHGNIAGTNQAHNKYELDIIKIMENEVFPYIKLLNKDQRNTFKNLYRNRKWNYDYVHKYKNGPKKARRAFVLENFDIILSSTIKNTFRKLYEKSSTIILTGLIMYGTYSFNIDYGTGITSILNINTNSKTIELINWFIGYTGLVILLLSVITKIFIVTYRLAIKTLRLYKHIV